MAHDVGQVRRERTKWGLASQTQDTIGNMIREAGISVKLVHRYEEQLVLIDRRRQALGMEGRGDSKVRGSGKLREAKVVGISPFELSVRPFGIRG